MAELLVDLFCEDSGHEVFTGALLRRLAAEVDVAVRITPRSVRGGHGRALTELKGWLRSPMRAPSDLLIVVVDANSLGWHRQRAEIERVVSAPGYPSSVIGCPDPEVEAWLCADPGALSRALGIKWAGPAPAQGAWKRALRSAAEDAGVPLLGDVMDLALDVVPEVDLYAACKVSPSLADFVHGLKSALGQAGG